MALCPVCKTECNDTTVCPECGFSDLSKVFITKQDAEEWYKAVVIPYKTRWHTEVKLNYILCDDGTYAINGIEDKEIIRVVIPNYYHGIAVTRIMKQAFWECASLFSVQMPESIISIEEAAFGKCVNLRTINLSQNLCAVESGCFIECRNLFEVIMPDTIECLGEFVFGQCSNLEHVKLPSHLETIPMQTFVGCSRLSKVDLPDNLSEVGEMAFAECSSLTDFFSMSVDVIGEGAFSDCEKLSSFFAYYITIIGKRAFSSCSSLKDLSGGEYLEYIGDYAFCDCTQLKNIYLLTDTNSKEKWSHIERGLHWDINTGEFTIHFDDGIIQKKNKYSNNGALTVTYYIDDAEIESHVQHW